MSVFCPAFLAQDHEGRERPKDGSLRGSELSPGDARSRGLGECGGSGPCPATSGSSASPLEIRQDLQKGSRAALRPGTAWRQLRLWLSSWLAAAPPQPDLPPFPPARTWGQGARASRRFAPEMLERLPGGARPGSL